MSKSAFSEVVGGVFHVCANSAYTAVQFFSSDACLTTSSNSVAVGSILVCFEDPREYNDASFPLRGPSTFLEEGHAPLADFAGLE